MTVGGSTSRVAFVTGASRGIGSGIALALARTGVAVGIGYQQAEMRAREITERIRANGGRAVAVDLDLCDRTAVRNAIGRIATQLGPIDILVNNAAIAQEKPFETIDDADWDRMQAVNLRGPFACSQECLPDMLKNGWGRIINIASIGGQWGGYNQVHYACAKAGLIALTRSLAKIYSDRGITANAVSPGLVATEMSASELESDAGKQKVSGIPAGRIGSIDEVAGAVVFLASDAASYVTGQTLNVNGGMYFG